MATLLIILSCLLFIAASACIWRSIVIAPVLSFLALLSISSATTAEGYPLLPVNSTILFAWLSITIVVTVATIMQPKPLRFTTKGAGYMFIGALAGMAVGLLGFTFASSLSMIYGIMIVATALGCYFGFLLYTNTPEGMPVSSGSGHFFKYFLAKAFPIAVTVMQFGVVAVLALALYQYGQG